MNPKTIAIVQSTAPVLKEYGEQITRTFYKRMFEGNPEMKNIFNMTHQKKGEQPKVLANAIFQYAQHIDRLEVLASRVNAIAHKHASLAITPAMYAIVGKHLLAAIAEVLGAAATPEIINAWAEAYQVLADILIVEEEELYDTGSKSIGGFRGHKDFVVARKVKESAVITSFYLQRKDGQPVPLFQPGQYVSLSVSIPHTAHRHTRNYSLSDCNGKDSLRISVKREIGNPNGMVSNYVHDSIAEGSVLSLCMPAGNFTLVKNDRPLLLLAGGVGITPLMSMYKQATKESNRAITFVQCSLNSAVHAFREETKEHARAGVEVITIYDQPLAEDKLGTHYDYEGYLSRQHLRAIPQLEACEIYFCGPKAFMQNVLRLLTELGMNEAQIHYEFFGPTEVLTTDELVRG
ncbi:MAG: NO-inducible flavohemoprotein [Aureispira sp.]